jgi:hypothetical protein
MVITLLRIIDAYLLYSGLAVLLFRFVEIQRVVIAVKSKVVPLRHEGAKG